VLLVFAAAKLRGPLADKKAATESGLAIAGTTRLSRPSKALGLRLLARFD
jgi:hypothetical protein